MVFKYLLEPIKINSMQLKNRMIMPALDHKFTPDGYATQQLIEYYNARAEGGIAMIILGGMRFDDYGAGVNMCSLRNDSYIESYKRLTDSIHQRGAKICAQLYHSGRYARRSTTLNHEPALSASTTTSRYTGEQAREMTIEEIKRVQRQWAEGAVRAQKAGFDAVEIIGCTGYLIPQFLSQLTNFRTDEYGGSWENRVRFAKEVVAQVRAAVGPDYPVLMRIAGNDFMEGGGGLPEAVAFAKEMEAAGIDMLNVTGGWHESRIPQISGEVPPGGYTYLAGEIKAAVNIPVAASNRMSDPKVAEEVLAIGKADLVCLGRVMVCDPEYPKKVTEGRPEEIRMCVACNQGCLANAFFAKPLDCILNGKLGKEYLYNKVPKAEKSKKILVVGGGPAGAELAYQAAARGHEVTLWEKQDRLGGQVHLVGVPENKKGFRGFIHYQERMLQKYGVCVSLNHEATAQEILDGNYDAVVIATGSIPKRFPLPQDKGAIPIYTAHEVLSGQSSVPGKNVVVVGGGSVGCETAHVLAERGSLSPEVLYFLSINKAEPLETIERLLNSTYRKVSIVEIQPKIGKGFDAGCAWPLLKDMDRLGVKKYASTQITEVGENSVTVAQQPKEGDTKVFQITCDTIVLAVGSSPNSALYEELEGKVTELYRLGDSNQVGKIRDCIHGAVELAMKL